MQVAPQTKVSVKLVAQAGIGTVASGVAKANADIIQISGHDGGTGASPVSSIKHAGGPIEMGLAETQQVMLSLARCSHTLLLICHQTTAFSLDLVPSLETVVLTCAQVGEGYAILSLAVCRSTVQHMIG